jgi:hypothetical protein
MKVDILVLVSTIAALSDAFSSPYYQQSSLINVDENAQRDVYTMQDWAVQCGVQQCDGFELTSYDGQDYCAVTQQPLAAGSPVLFVPEGMVLSSTKAALEFGDGLYEAERILAESNLQQQVPLFRIFCKILIEYEKGVDSPWYPWLNSVPRLYNNGAAMTYTCFDCIPPYAGWCALKERQNSVNFQKAVRYVPYISEDTKSTVDVLKWAYNVAATRSIPYGDGSEVYIAPMADMFNHGTFNDVVL